MTNTLAYYDMELITAVKKFYSESPWAQHSIFLDPQNTNDSNKPILMFVSKAGAYQSEAPFKILAISANNRLGWRVLPRKNTLAYYTNS